MTHFPRSEAYAYFIADLAFLDLQKSFTIANVVKKTKFHVLKDPSHERSVYCSLKFKFLVSGAHSVLAPQVLYWYPIRHELIFYHQKG